MFSNGGFPRCVFFCLVATNAILASSGFVGGGEFLYRILNLDTLGFEVSISGFRLAPQRADVLLELAYIVR